MQKWAMGFIKVMARSTQSVVEVTVLAYGQGVKMKTKSKSMTKLSGGDHDVEPSLSSRNKLGNRTATQILNDPNVAKLSKFVAVKQWWFAEVGAGG